MIKCLRMSGIPYRINNKLPIVDTQNFELQTKSPYSHKKCVLKELV